MEKEVATTEFEK